jgi:hypothetical protein
VVFWFKAIILRVQEGEEYRRGVRCRSARQKNDDRLLVGFYQQVVGGAELEMKNNEEQELAGTSISK